MADLRALSLRLEKETGYDSIPTIERVYEMNDRGTYVCVWPDCRFKRTDAEAMWRHVHFGPHGQPFGVADPLLIDGEAGS